MSDEIQVDSCDLEEIYYSSNPLEIFCGLLKKFKLYVISREIDDCPFLFYVEKQLKQLPPDYMARWITADCLFGKQKSNSNNKTKRHSSIYEVLEEEIHL